MDLYAFFGILCGYGLAVLTIVLMPMVLRPLSPFSSSHESVNPSPESAANENDRDEMSVSVENNSIYPTVCVWQVPLYRYNRRSIHARGCHLFRTYRNRMLVLDTTCRCLRSVRKSMTLFASHGNVLHRSDCEQRDPNEIDMPLMPCCECWWVLLSFSRRFALQKLPLWKLLYGTSCIRWL